MKEYRFVFVKKKTTLPPSHIMCPLSYFFLSQIISLLQYPYFFYLKLFFYFIISIQHLFFQLTHSYPWP